MKKLLVILMACTVLFCLTACSGSETSSENADPPVQPSVPDSNQTSESAAEPTNSEPEAADPKALVVYFSTTGNTQSVAEALAEMQGADLYELVPEQPYTSEDLNYSDPASRATLEQTDDTVRPALAGALESIDDYEVIYVGFPIWWGNMPRILYTFFDTYDLSGKTIAPFCTSGSSGITQAVQTISALEPDAAITVGLRTSTSNIEHDLSQWLSSIGLTE